MKDSLRAAGDAVVSLQPGLDSQELVFSDQEDDVLGPVDLRSEELGGAEQESDAGVC